MKKEKFILSFKYFLVFYIIQFLSACSNHENVIKKRIYFKENKAMNYSYYDQYFSSNSAVLDSEYFYNKNNQLEMIYYYKESRINIIKNIKNGKIRALQHLDSNYALKYNFNGGIEFKVDYNDSIVYSFYKYSNKLKKVSRLSYLGIYYTNYYDSCSGKITSTFRRSFDEYKYYKDGFLYIYPRFPEPCKINQFSFKIDILDKNQKIKNSFYVNKVDSPFFKIPYNGKGRMYWNKTICDDDGCCITPGSFEDLDN